MNAVTTIVATVALACGIVALARSLDAWKYAKDHRYNRYQVEMAYLQGYEDALFNRKCDTTRGWNDKEVDA